MMAEPWQEDPKMNSDIPDPSTGELQSLDACPVLATI